MVEMFPMIWFKQISTFKLKNDRGFITKGGCFKLDKTQNKLIKIIQKDHLDNPNPKDLKVKHVFLSGSFGTGKTVVIVEICWMRINYLLRRIRDKKAGGGKKNLLRKHSIQDLE